MIRTLAIGRGKLTGLALFASFTLMEVQAADIYDSNANQLTMASVQVGNTTYHDVRIRFDTPVQVLHVGSHAVLPGSDVYDPAANQLSIRGVTVGGASFGDVLVQLGGFTVLSFGESTPGTTTQPVPQIARIRVVAQPVVVFDHLIDKLEPNHLPDLPPTAWKEADGTVNVTISHFENYRLRGPDLEHLASDRNKILSSSAAASEILESHYNYHHWLAAPYTFDGHTVYGLTHTEWYACLLNSDCNFGQYEGPSNAVTVNSFKSSDGGASWTINGLNAAHVVANEAFTWTGSAALASAVYKRAVNHTGLMLPSRLVKEGNYFYSIGFLNHRDFTRLDPATGQAPIDKYDWVLFRTNDVAAPAGWEGWVSGNQYTPMASHLVNAFYPWKNGSILNAGQAQIIYDTNARLFIAIFVIWDSPGAIYYVTTPSLANPTWTDAAPIEGAATIRIDPRSPTAACSTGFEVNNYVSLMDSHSGGLNFEFTDGDPWLFYVINPALRCGGDNLARDMYRLQLAIDYN